MLYVVADHGGFTLKEKILAWLRQEKISVVDLGPERVMKNDDYPLAATRLAQAVQRSPQHRGIAICRTGVGMAMVSNKHQGIRAVQAITPAIAVRSRQDENTNVLSLAADYQTWPEVQSIIQQWLGASYRGKARHQRRLRQIKKIEHGR